MGAEPDERSGCFDAKTRETREHQEHQEHQEPRVLRVLREEAT
jgi:hypothetical protein